MKVCTKSVKKGLFAFEQQRKLENTGLSVRCYALRAFCEAKGREKMFAD